MGATFPTIPSKLKDVFLFVGCTVEIAFIYRRKHIIVMGSYFSIGEKQGDLMVKTGKTRTKEK